MPEPLFAKQVHISHVRAGDVVRHAGKDRTISAKDIKRGFMGVTIWGDSYRLGRDLVTLCFYR